MYTHAVSKYMYGEVKPGQLHHDKYLLFEQIRNKKYNSRRIYGAGGRMATVAGSELRLGETENTVDRPQRESGNLERDA